METSTSILIIVALVLLVGGAVAVRLLIPKAALKLAQRKLSPAERDAFIYKADLLKHKDIVEFYAPSKDFQRKLEGDKKSRKQASWVSAYPAAVKASQNAHKYESKKVQMLARQQIVAAAANVSIATLPSNLQPANPGPEHFSITLRLDGKPEEKVRALASTIKSQLGLHSLELADADDYVSVKYIGHAVAPMDRLMTTTAGAEFFDNNPPLKPSLLPLAIKADGCAWSMPVAHTLIYGTTGSGKGSVIQGIIRQVAPYVKAGTTKLYGIDPKNSELAPFEHSSLFTDYAFENADIEVLIETVHKLMKLRAQNKKVDLKNAELGRSLEYTIETPLVLLVIDEFFSMILALSGTKSGKNSVSLLNEILAQGRSLGVIVVGATQIADKEILGTMRANIVNWIVLRIDSVYFNDLFLGQDSAGQGFNATKIPPSSKGNNYASAGIAYVKEETGSPVRVRFAYTSDRELADLILANPAQHASAADFEDVEPTETELDESWDITEVPDDETASDFDDAMPDILDELPNLDEMPELDGAMPAL